MRCTRKLSASLEPARCRTAIHFVRQLSQSTGDYYNSLIIMVLIHQRHRQTDGQTDGRTTCSRNTALWTKCIIVHRAVKTVHTGRSAQARRSQSRIRHQETLNEKVLVSRFELLPKPTEPVTVTVILDCGWQAVPGVCNG